MQQQTGQGAKAMKSEYVELDDQTVFRDDEEVAEPVEEAQQEEEPPADIPIALRKD